MNRIVPVATTQLARRLAVQVTDYSSYSSWRIFLDDHKPVGQDAVAAIAARYRTRYDYRALARSVVLYFDGDNEDDVRPEVVTAMRAAGFTDNILSPVYDYRAWRTYPLLTSDAPHAMNYCAIALSQRVSGSFNIIETLEYSHVDPIGIATRPYTTTVQFIFDTHGNVERVI